MLSETEVLDAAADVAKILPRTPTVTSEWFDQRLSSTLFFKCENLQRTGSFKVRGVLTALRRLPPERRRRGVHAYSSGNHALALAWAGARLGIPVTVLMPWDAPDVKVAGARHHGATVLRYDRYTDDRESLARELAESAGTTLIPSADSADIVAGQGTAAVELIDEVGPLDVLVVPVGGGGLAAGTVLAAKALSPGCEVVGVEPANGNDAELSLRHGRLVSIDTPRTIADGAQVRHLGRLPFAILREHGTRVVTADDAELVETMALISQRLHIVAEPTACLPLAAVLAGAVPVAGRRIGVLISGGNVDLGRYAHLLGGGPAGADRQPGSEPSSSRRPCEVRG
ncbi:MAG TPA: pyridoxal-phosphate dependent enzyme [Nonomuraea sp.]|nr:pyridoxal-phosphate dependent enzyme [Nonomuraea sp.]